MADIFVVWKSIFLLFCRGQQNMTTTVAHHCCTAAAEGSAGGLELRGCPNELLGIQFDAVVAVVFGFC